MRRPACQSYPEDAQRALMTHHVHMGAETEGPGWSLLAVILLFALSIVLRFAGLWEDLGVADPIVVLVLVGFALVAGILYWRRLMVQRRKEHVHHVRKASEYAKRAGPDVLQPRRLEATASPGTAPRANVDDAFSLG